MTRQPSTAALLTLGAAAMANRAAAELLFAEGLGAFLQPELLRVADSVERLIERAAHAPQPPPVSPSAVLPETPGPQPTATQAVQAATLQLGEGATARDIAAHIARAHGLQVTPDSIRALRSRLRNQPPGGRPQQPETPAPGTGGYL